MPHGTAKKKKNLETNENENMTIQNPWEDAAKQFYEVSL